jgi:hypothetical protein
VLQEQPTHYRAERRAGRESGGPDRDGQPALGAVAEERAQQCERGGHQHGTEEPEEGPGGHELCRLRGECRDERDRAEAGRTDHQRAAAADPVAEGPHGHQQAGQHERVDVHEPQQLCRRRRERRADRGQRETEHGVVDRDEQRRQEQHGEPEPLAAAGADGAVCGDGHLRTSGRELVYTV